MEEDRLPRERRADDLGSVERIPMGEGKLFEVGGARVAVFRARSGKVFAAQTECPHRGGPLADGLLGGALVSCPLHGFRFDLVTGRPVGHECGALRIYPVELTPAGSILLHWEAR